MAMWQGGSAGARLFRANFQQLREELLRTGLLTQAELDDDLAQLDDPLTLFLRITPNRRVSTYGVGVPLRVLLRDPLHADRTFHLRASA